MILGIVPLNRLDRVKTRLQDCPVDRPGLACRLAERVIGALREAALPVVLVSPQENLREWAQGLGATFHRQSSVGLNPALEEVRAAFQPERCLVALGDLPDLLGSEVLSLLAQPEDVVAACDWLESGTNLLLCGPRMPFRFGPDSFARHRQAAAERALRFGVYRSPGTGLDLDSPQQLEDYLCRIP